MLLPALRVPARVVSEFSVGKSVTVRVKYGVDLVIDAKYQEYGKARVHIRCIVFILNKSETVLLARNMVKQENTKEYGKAGVH